MSIEDAKKLIESQKEQIAKLEKTISELNGTIANLNETISYLTKKIYGTKREKAPDSDPNQMTLADLGLFNETEAEADPDAKEPAKEQLIKGYTRTSQGKKAEKTFLTASR